jgi:hypothetical protein
MATQRDDLRTNTNRGNTVNRDETDLNPDLVVPAADRDATTEPDDNPDAITGAPGSHPVGTGIGAAGAGAAGAAIGSAAGPVGTVVGAVVGAVAGGLAGKGVAEAVNPTAEEAYWRENYASRPYYSNNYTYEDYAPAYRYGWESRTRYPDRDFNDVEPDLSRDWDRTKAKSRLSWEHAKDATRDAWDRVTGQRDESDRT